MVTYVKAWVDHLELGKSALGFVYMHKVKPISYVCSHLVAAYHNYGWET